MPILMLFFVIVPIIEITVLISVGGMIGVWSTVGLVLLSAFIGVNMLRYQGVATLATARARMQNGELPAQEMLEGILLAVGGALLITPGFVTDIMGFCCLIPFSRRAMVGFIKKHTQVVGGAQFNGSQQGFYHHDYRNTSSTASDGDVVDAEYVDLDAKKVDTDK